MRGRWRLGITIVTAWMLVIQSLAIAHAAAGPQVDRFGNPLCVTDTDTSHHGGHHHSGSHHGGPDHNGQHDGGNGSPLPNCCTLACGACAAVIAAPLGENLAHAEIDVGPATARHADFVSRGPEPRPGSPRAPPALS